MITLTITIEQTDPNELTLHLVAPASNSATAYEIKLAEEFVAFANQLADRESKGTAQKIDRNQFN